MHHFLGILEIEFFEKIIVNVYVIKKIFCKYQNQYKSPYWISKY
jgi:hypothetical protein